MPTQPVYSVQPSAAAMRDLEGPLDMPNRSPQLPPVYLWKNSGPHPQRNLESDELDGKTYVIFIDGSVEGKRRADKLAQAQKVPLGREVNAQSLGECLIRLEPGDWIFARHFDSDGDPSKDIVQVFLSMAPYLEAMRERVAKARDHVLGPRDERTAEHVRFERSAHAKRSRGDDRAYGIGEMVQLSRKVDAPAASVKVYDGQLDEDQEAQKEFLTAVATVIVEIYRRTAPERWLQVMKEFNEVINGPITGCDGNFWFPSFQVNIAPAQDGDSDGSLILEMKISGTEHMDTHDAVTGLSCMLVASDLPNEEGAEPGRFHFLAHGFYVNLETDYAVFFSGRLPHGGTAPLAAPGKKALNWAYRTVVIGYPPKYIMDGDVRHSLAALPHRAEPLYLSPEITGVNSQYPDNIMTSNHSNYACDGVMTMAPQAHFDFFVRALLMIVIMILRQLPIRYNVHVDRETFLSAFSAENEDEPMVATPWELGPDGRVHQEPNPEAPREQALDRYKDLYAHIAPGIHRADNKYPEPEGHAGRRKNEQGAKRPAGQLSDKAKKRREKIEREKASAAKNATITAMFAAGGLPSAWDAAIDGEEVQDSEDHEVIDVDRMVEEDCEEVEESDGDEELYEQDQEAVGKPAKRKRVEDSDYEPPSQEPEGPQSDYHTRSRKRRRGNQLQDTEAMEREETTPAEGVPDTTMQAVGADLNLPTNGDPAEEHEGAINDGTIPEVDEGEEGSRTDTNGWSDVSSLTTIEDSDQGEPTAGPVGTDSTKKTSVQDDAAMSRRSTSARGFVAQINVTALTSEINRISAVLEDIDKVGPDSLLRALKIVSRVNLGVVTAKDRSISAREITETFGAVGTMRKTAEWHYAWSNVLHQRVMLCERHMTINLTSRLEEIARATLSNTTRPLGADVDAFTRIVLRIKDNLQCGMATTLSSTTYMPEAGVEVEYTEKAPKNLYTEEEILREAPKMAIRVLRHWFDLPDANVTEARANYVTILMYYYGPGALLLPHVWEIYLSMPSWTSDQEVQSLKRTNVPFAKEQHRTLRAIVAASKPADHTSDAFLNLHTLKHLYRDLVDSAHGSLIAADAGSVPKKQKGKIVEDNYDVEDEIAAGPTPVQGDEAEAAGTVARLLRAAGEVATPTGRTLSRLATLIAAKTDTLQPLREEGISRTRINGRDGELLTAAHAATRPGLFSLLIFRNVLYNSEYLHTTTLRADERRVLFTTPEDFRTHIDGIAETHGIREKEKYFCNRRAFGSQTIQHRKTGNASQYWNLAEACKVEGQAERPAEFEEMRKRLNVAADAEDIKGFGDLSRYLTLADMCATGIVKKPNDKEVGQCIARLRAGGRKGLMLLGYLETKKAYNMKEVVNAFQTYYRAATKALSPEEQEELGWDTLVAEHTLCKVTRLWDDL